LHRRRNETGGIMCGVLSSTRRSSMVALTAWLAYACASGGAENARVAAAPRPLVAVDGRTDLSDEVETTAIVRIVNRTTTSVRISLIYDGTTHLLGNVPALETREIPVVRKTLVGIPQLQLGAAPRVGSGQEISEVFSLSGARLVEWQLDARHLHSVTLR